MRVLLTGIAGFAGSVFAEYLVREVGVELHGVVHRHDRRIQHLLNQIQLHRGDLRNALWVSDLVQAVQPDITLHLAAWSDVGGSWQQPWTTYELNIQCQLNLLEALHRACPTSRALVVSSNEVYGLVQPDELPIAETTPLRPSSPYGVSKIAQDMMAFQYYNSHRMPVIRARSFNHLGPGQSDDFAASAFARQIAEIEAGLREPIVHVGNLDAQRDFTDVRDVVRAYWLLALHGASGECYNVGSGQPRPIRWLLDTLVALSTVPVQVQVDAQRLRPSDIPVSYADIRKLQAATGWAPAIDLRTTLYELLESWRAQRPQHATFDQP